MRHDQRAGGAEFDGEVAVGDGVQRIAAHAFKAQGLGDAFAVDRERRAGQGGGAQRQAVHAAAAIGQALGVAAEHFGVRQQVMAEGDGLGDLQVREARHDGAGVFQRDRGQRVAQLAQQDLQRVDFVTQPQADVGGDLVVARTAGVQALARVAHQFHQALFDVQVDVFQVEQPLERAGVDFGQDLGHAALDVGQILGADDALGGQHVRMRERALDVVARQALVEIHGRRVAFDEFGNRLGEPGGPGLRLVGELVLIGGGSLCHDGRDYRASRRAG